MIARLLATARPEDADERAHLAAMWSLARNPRCRERDLWDPGHFTASAFVLSPDARSIALIHHRKLGIWCQPGGHLEPDDVDLQGAARREVAEEIGLGELELLGPAPFDLDVHVIPARPDQPAHRHFDVRFLFRAPHDGLAASEEVRDARWVALTEVSGRGTYATDASVLRAVRKVLAQQGDHRVVQQAVRREG